MPLKTFVLETCVAPGTATTISLVGAATGRNSFVGAGFTAGQLVEYYFMDDGTIFEWGIGTFHTGTPNTLDRTTVLGNSSGTNVRLNFGGITDVYNEIPAERAVFVSSTGIVNLTGGLSVGGTLTYKQVISIPSVNTTIALTDYGTKFYANAGPRVFTAPLTSSVGSGFFFDVANYGPPTAPIAVSVVRSGSDIFDTAGTTVWVLPFDTVRFTSNGAGSWLTQGRTAAGRLVNASTYTNAGSSTASLTPVNLITSGASFVYQPVSSASIIVVNATWQALVGFISGTTTTGNFYITEGGLGTAIATSVGVSPNGALFQGPLGQKRFYANAAISTRSFQLFGAISNASTTIAAGDIQFMIQEYHNA
jgi:hypothetical protein